MFKGVVLVPTVPKKKEKVPDLNLGVHRCVTDIKIGILREMSPLGRGFKSHPPQISLVVFAE